MTTRLYYTDAYLTDFEARVVAVADGGRRVYLDRTAFYPTSGGQPCDTGTLGGVPVVDVVDEDERIAHLLGSPLAADAGDVTGTIDRARRFDHMQQHTGQHLLSAVFAELFGVRTVSVHFGRETSTIDLDVEALTAEQVVEAESVANAVVTDDRAVGVSFEEAETAAGLRKASDRAGTLRVVTIEGLDRSACGGTHVRATGEIGAILVRRLERVRRAMRVEFVCGVRAVRSARADFTAASEVARLLSVPIGETPGAVATLAEQLREAATGRKRLEGELHVRRARERYDATTPDASGVRRIVERRETGAVEELKGMAQALTTLPQAVFVGLQVEPPVLVVAASEDSGVDAAAALRVVLAEAGGRGGGSPRMAQGTLPDAAAAERALRGLKPTASSSDSPDPHPGSRSPDR